MDVVFQTFGDERMHGGPGQVVRVGKIFQAGHWPDRGVTITGDDLARQAAEFHPVELELEHFYTNRQQSIFDGKLGSLDAVWRQGQDLWGKVRVPEFVSRCWGEAGYKISVVLDPQTKLIQRAGLVVSPKIQDAQLSLAFSEYEERAGRVEQKEQPMSKLDEILASLKAQLSPAFSENSDSGDEQPEPEADEKDGQEALTAPPKPTSSNVVARAQQGAASYADDDALLANPKVQGLLASVDRLQKQVSESQRREREAIARSQVDRLVAEGKVPVYSADDATAELTECLEDDARDPRTYQFANGSKGGRFDRRIALFEAQPRNPLLIDADDIGGILPSFGNGGKKEDNPWTPEGAAEAAKRWNSRNGGATARKEG